MIIIIINSIIIMICLIIICSVSFPCHLVYFTKPCGMIQIAIITNSLALRRFFRDKITPCHSDVTSLNSPEVIGSSFKSLATSRGFGPLVNLVNLVNLLIRYITLPLHLFSLRYTLCGPARLRTRFA